MTMLYLHTNNGKIGLVTIQLTMAPRNAGSFPALPKSTM
jgi:hypothetical protein